MFRFSIAAFIGGAALAYFTFQEARLSFKSSSVPEEIALRKLLARGPDGNAHIILTDFELCGNYVNQMDKNNTNWAHVWIPAVPSDEVDPKQKVPPNPPGPKVIIFSTNVRSLPDLEMKLNKPKLQGMVTNGITSLESKTQDLLKQQYPQIDLNKCLIFQEGRTPAGGALLFLMGGCTLLCFLLGIGLLGATFLRSRAA